MKKVFFTIICALLLVACMPNELIEVSVLKEEVKKVYASIGNTDTRVQLNDEKKTVWTESDTIVVVTPETSSCYVFDGKTGDRGGSFSYIGDKSFDNGIPSDYGVTEPFAIYPHRSLRGIANDTHGDLYVFVRVANQQKYIKDSYGLHSNAMFGTSEDGGKTFNFINLFGYLRFSLTGSKAVRRILLWDNSYSYIAGSFYFHIDNPDELWGYDEFQNYIELDCGEEGVQLSDEPVNFYFALPPFDMAEGLSISVEFTDGTEYYQRTTNRISLKRNTIKPMATISTDGDMDWQYIRIRHTGAFADSPWVYGKSSMSGYIYWGDESWTWVDMYSYRHTYEDPEGSREVTIKVHDADSVIFRGVQGVGKIDLSEF